MGKGNLVHEFNSYTGAACDMHAHKHAYHGRTRQGAKPAQFDSVLSASA